jgi:ferric-dicitrate binding protein FerR (iron transport regulator)
MSNEAEREKLLARWLNGELSPEEQQQLEADGGLDDLRFALDDIKDWSLPEMDTTKGLDDVLDRAFREPPAKKARQVFFQPLLRIAASLLLVAAAYFVINNLLMAGDTTISTGPGETLSYVLPDGSQVNLDAMSSITFSKNKWDNNRYLSMEGRALFSAEKGSTFKVDTESGSVTVLGTVFEVERFDSDLMNVNCYEGRVQVDLITANTKELLAAGQGLTAQQNTVTRLLVEKDKPDWLSRISNYEDTPLSKVMADLERHHNVNITLPAEHASERFTGQLSYQDLNKALEELAAIFELTYSRTNEGQVVFE